MQAGWWFDFLPPRRTTPLPPFFVDVPGTALGAIYGASARAATRNTCFIGWAEASSRRMRRVLRTTAALQQLESDLAQLRQAARRLERGAPR